MGAALSALRGLASGRGTRRRPGSLRPIDAAAAAADAADASSPLWIEVGLGNPGPRYERTRHNVGWRVVDALAARAGTALDKAQCTAAVGRGLLAGQRVLLVKPLTFMNVSGEAVGGLAKFYRVPPSRVIAVYDDLDTAPSRVRLRGGGGHGGHNGVRSLIQHFGGDKAFARVRIGEEWFFCCCWLVFLMGG
jgi:PTH1 family peptidyl-tRNA hydrolase